MHPNRAFRPDHPQALDRMVDEIGFGQLFAQTPDGPRVAHVPAVTAGDAIRFHLARSNALTRHLDGAVALFVVTGPDAYISPDWYGEADQVPTWNYIAAEFEGTVRRLDQAGLVEQIDTLTAREEARLAKTEWTRAKMDGRIFDRMLDAIVGFELVVTERRGTVKLNQNKPAEARLAAAEALDRLGRSAIAERMREVER